MRLVAYDPYVSADRARQLGVELVPDARGARRDRRLPHDPPPEDPETIGLIDAELLAKAKPGLRLVNTARGGIVDEARAGRRDRGRHDRRRRARRVRDRAHHRVTAVRAAERGRHAAPRRVDGRGPGQGRSDDRRAGRARAARASSCRSRSTSRRPRPTPPCSRSSRWSSGSAGCSPRWPAACVDTLEVGYEGQIADYDCRVLTLGGAEGRARRRSSTSR